MSRPLRPSSAARPPKRQHQAVIPNDEFPSSSVISSEHNRLSHANPPRKRMQEWLGGSQAYADAVKRKIRLSLPIVSLST